MWMSWRWRQPIRRCRLARPRPLRLLRRRQATLRRWHRRGRQPWPTRPNRRRRRRRRLCRRPQSRWPAPAEACSTRRWTRSRTRPMRALFSQSQSRQAESLLRRTDALAAAVVVVVAVAAARRRREATSDEPSSCASSRVS